MTKKYTKKRDRPLSVGGLQNQKPKFMKPFTNNVNSRIENYGCTLLALQRYKSFRNREDFF